MLKKLIAVISAMALMLNCGTFCYAEEKFDVENENSDIEFEVSVDDLKDGVSVVLVRDENGNLYSYVCDDPSQIPMACSEDDGVIESATFHLGFKNWSGTNGSLYLSFTCDEATDVLKGDFYVKSTDLIPTTYWGGTATYDMFGCHSTTRYVSQGIYVGYDTVLKVQFKNVTFTTATGASGSFADASTKVYK